MNRLVLLLLVSLCSSSFAGVRDLIETAWSQEEAKQYLDAIDTLDKTTEATIDKEPDILIKAQYRFLYALAHQEWADSHLRSPDFKLSYQTFAETARDKWKAYIKWFEGLSTTDQEVVGPIHRKGQKPLIRNIGMVVATNNLGITMHLLDQDEDLLDYYEKLDSTPLTQSYFGVETLDRWRTSLLWPGKQTELTRRLLKRVITTANADRWRAFAKACGRLADRFSQESPQRASLRADADLIEQCLPAQ